MAISVISSASTTATPALVSMAADESAPAGFADLLFSQLSNAILAASGQVTTDAKDEKATAAKEQSTESDTPGADPTLAFLMASPTVQTPQAAKPDTSFAGSRAGQIAPTGTEALPLVADGKPDTPPAAAVLPGSSTDSSASRSSFAEALGQQAPSAETVASALAGTTPRLPAGNNTGKNGIDDTAARAKPSVKESVMPGLEGKPNNTMPAAPLTTTENPLPTGKSVENPSPAANIAVESSTPPTGQESSLLAAGNGNQAAKLDAAAQVKNEVTTPLHNNGWARDFSDKVVWLAKNDQQQAQININPPQLGPIQITLNISGDQASAVFTSPHAEVRQVIENSLPQLKEMLSGAGINLGQADVGANLAQQNRETPSQSMNGNRFANENAILPGNGNTGDNKISAPLQRGRGLVDLFA